MLNVGANFHQTEKSCVMFETRSSLVKPISNVHNVVHIYGKSHMQQEIVIGLHYLFDQPLSPVT